MFRFKRSKKKLLGDIQVLLDEISDDLDDIRSDIGELQESVAESLRLTLIIQEQCNEIISKMEKNRTLEEIVDNIEKLVGKDNAKE